MKTLADVSDKVIVARDRLMGLREYADLQSRSKEIINESINKLCNVVIILEGLVITRDELDKHDKDPNYNPTGRKASDCFLEGT